MLYDMLCTCCICCIWIWITHWRWLLYHMCALAPAVRLFVYHLRRRACVRERWTASDEKRKIMSPSALRNYHTFILDIYIWAWHRVCIWYIHYYDDDDYCYVLHTKPNDQSDNINIIIMKICWAIHIYIYTIYKFCCRCYMPVFAYLML